MLSVLTLGVLGTGLAYVWNTNVVAGWGATNASTVTYLTPWSESLSWLNASPGTNPSGRCSSSASPSAKTA